MGKRPAKPEPLPALLDDFRELVARARREQEREALLTRVQDEYKSQPRKTRAAQGRFEERLLAFIDRPALARDASLPLHFSHMEAWAELLELRSRGFAQQLRKFIKSADRGLRGEAAEYLAWLAFEEDLPTILKILRSKDGHVVAKAAGGAGSAAAWDRLSEEQRRRLFEAIARVINRGQQEIAAADELGDLPKSLVKLNPVAAAGVLGSKKCLSPENGLARSIVSELVALSEDVLAEQWKPVDAGLLWTLFESAKRRRVRGRAAEVHKGFLANILKLTAQSEPNRTRREAKELQKELPRDQTGVARALREVLMRCENVPDPLSLWAWMDRNPGRLLKEVEQRMRAFELSQHMMTDGIAGYFDNAGDRWAEALAGLRLLSLSREAEQFEAIAGSFAPGARQSRGRAKMKDAIAPAAARKLERLCKAFDAKAQFIAAAIERCMVAQPELFRRRI